MQLLFYEKFDLPEPEGNNKSERSSDNKEYPLLLQIPADILPDEEEKWILASVTFIGNL
jgi:hypothetical protein